MHLMTLKKKFTPRTTVRLPEDVHQAAKMAASARGEPLQEFIAEGVRIRLRSLGFGATLDKDKPMYPRIKRAGGA